MATSLEELFIAPQSLSRFQPLIGEERMRETEISARETAHHMVGRAWWNVSSTARGGGVAEMLRSLLSFARGADIDARWAVIHGTPEFFTLTKRLHHALHGLPGDGSALGETQRRIYESTLQANAKELLPLVQPRDVVLLHDPQTAGLAPYLVRHGAIVIWRSHIGIDESNEQTRMAWEFLDPYIHDVDATVFSRESYIPPSCKQKRWAVIPPSIDAFSAKNQALDDATVRAILVHTGLVEGPPGDGQPIFHREDGTPARVDRQAVIVRQGRAPEWERNLIVQVSRWDPLKDPVGVMRGFVMSDTGDMPADAELVLAGPSVTAVADDPEGAETFERVVDAWRQLPDGDRERIHLVSLPMADVEENAAIVNALQRHAAVVVQKSLREGFGLTVTEAMWKGRPMVASRVGGIQDQITDGIDGLLVEPTDLSAFNRATRTILDDPALAARMGANARQRVINDFLGVRHLEQYARLLADIETARPD